MTTVGPIIKNVKYLMAGGEYNYRGCAHVCDISDVKATPTPCLGSAGLCLSAEKIYKSRRPGAEHMPRLAVPP